MFIFVVGNILITLFLATLQTPCDGLKMKEVSTQTLFFIHSYFHSIWSEPFITKNELLAAKSFFVGFMLLTVNLYHLIYLDLLLLLATCKCFSYPLAVCFPSSSSSLVSIVWPFSSFYVELSKVIDKLPFSINDGG